MKRDDVAKYYEILEAEMHISLKTANSITDISQMPFNEMISFFQAIRKQADK